MPLKLIHGPPNSGRAGLIRSAFAAAAERDPVLVLPTVDDVFTFERELAGGGAALGGAAMTFRALFGRVATGAGAPPGAVLSPAQRLRCVDAAVERLLPQLGPLRRSAARPGFARAFVRLLDELQAAAVEPGAVEASAGTLEGSAYLADIAALFAGYEATRERSGRVDSHGVARAAIDLLRRDPASWGERPVFLYGLDDLTPVQFDLVAALAARTEVTVALTFEPGNAALAARAELLTRLRDWIGAREDDVVATEADPGNTASATLYALARGFGDPGAEPIVVGAGGPGSDLTLLRSAGARGEAEAIAGEVSRLLHGGAVPDEIGIALRDPARRGPELAAALEANGVAAALEAEVPVAGTAVGGALVALLDAEFGTRRAADVLRYLRGPSGFPPGRVDWLERSIRRQRVDDADTALALWRGERGRRGSARPHPPADRRRRVSGRARRRRRNARHDDGLAAAAQRRGRPGARGR